MAKSLTDWMRIAGELKVAQEQLKAAKADGKVTVDEGLDLAGDILAILVKNQVTIDELADLVQSIGPLLPILKKLG